MIKTKLGVFFGGKSVEHDISIISALQIMNKLDEDKYEIIPVYVNKEGVFFTGEALLDVTNYKVISELEKKATEVYLTATSNDPFLYPKKTGLLSKAKPIQIDLIFPIFHGTLGEDGCFQGLFEIKNLPYVGSDVFSSALCMNKFELKEILKQAGITVVEGITISKRSWFFDKAFIEIKISEIGFPLIVKPNNLGSSVGVSAAHNMEELEEALNNAFQFAEKTIVEKFIKENRELNCAVYGNAAEQHLSLIEEPFKGDTLLSFDNKYKDDINSFSGMSGLKRKVPADITKEMEAEVHDMARKAYITSGCGGMVRIDFIVDTSDNKVYLNEINTIPGSLAYYLWPDTTPYRQILDQMIVNAVKRKEEKEDYNYDFPSYIFEQSDISLNKFQK